MLVADIKPESLYLCGEHPSQWMIPGDDLLAKLNDEEALQTDNIEIKEVTP